MEQLKPCPFCGSKDIIFEGVYGERPTCNVCGAEIDGWSTYDEAISAWNRRAQPANEPLTLDELREMKVPCPLYKEETPSGDMTESAIEPVLFKGIHCGKEERACWVTCEAHNANSRIEHIAKGEIKFYRWPPERGAGM